MNFKPLNDRILIKPEPKKEKIGRILLPEEAKKESMEGTVVALGTAKNFEVSIGDKVIFNKYGSMDIDVEGNQYKLLTSDDILAIIK